MSYSSQSVHKQKVPRRHIREIRRSGLAAIGHKWELDNIQLRLEGDRAQVPPRFCRPGVFALDAVRTLVAAFDGAWQSIVASGARLLAQQAELTRELLAKYIIEQARQGELDERRLRDGALLQLAQSNLGRLTSSGP